MRERGEKGEKVEKDEKTEPRRTCTANVSPPPQARYQPGEKGSHEKPREVDEHVSRLTGAPGHEELQALVRNGNERDEVRGWEGRPPALGEAGSEEAAREDAEHSVLGEMGELSDDQGHELRVAHAERLEERARQRNDKSAFERGLRALHEGVPPDERHPARKRDGPPKEGGPSRRVVPNLGRHASAARGVEKCLPTYEGAETVSARWREVGWVPPSSTRRTRRELRRAAVEEFLENSSSMR